eukprot:TRINITY_DN4884_c0_g1_i1.p1 TRINITY_DN4884_c0_g1~~TRINITY_DN4884_c0_g1_i1.p1  ORF type:complete len:171 (-),score=82.31 TRINITY_DN4884_c0_g1_i1:52-498(-)
MSKKKGAIGFSVEECREAFQLIDTDHSGYIEASELTKVLGLLGDTKPSAKKVERLLKLADTDGDGRINFKEFCHIMQHDRKREEEILTAFNQYDLDGDGFISPEELSAVMASTGSPISPAELQSMISSLDANGDGKIDYVEFIKLFGL